MKPWMWTVIIIALILLATWLKYQYHPDLEAP
jgi:hypothetical protein